MYNELKTNILIDENGEPFYRFAFLWTPETPKHISKVKEITVPVKEIDTYPNLLQQLIAIKEWMQGKWIVGEIDYKAWIDEAINFLFQVQKQDEIARIEAEIRMTKARLNVLESHLQALQREK